MTFLSRSDRTQIAPRALPRFTVSIDQRPQTFAAAVRAGLGMREKCLPPRFFYDAPGSELFDRICEQPEYYPFRTEARILERCAPALRCGGTTIAELGCGYGHKTTTVLDALSAEVREFVPIDVSYAVLAEAGRTLLARYPRLLIRAHVAEFASAPEILGGSRGLVLFLGSNIGNLEPDEAAALLASLREHHVLVGFDLRKDEQTLLAAYDDRAGVTAEFNKNVLCRINRELGGEIDVGAWRHVAVYDRSRHRIEMHLEATRDQSFRVAALGATFAIRAGERIHTENSYKFSEESIQALAARAGVRVAGSWTDEHEWFCIALLAP
jgi:L-histidine N-alpha-methyltransferase